MPRYSRSRSFTDSRSPPRRGGRSPPRGRYSRSRSRSPYRGGGRGRSPYRNNSPYRGNSPYRDSRRDSRRDDRRGGDYIENRTSRMSSGNRRNQDRLRHMRENERRDRDRYGDRYDDRRGGGRYDDRGRGGGRYDDRGRGGRSRSRTPEEQLDEFRHPKLSRSPPNEDDRKNWECDKMALEEKQVAYVFGRMGSTKDKIARVSGARVDLVGQELVFQGDKVSIKRAMAYVKILLSQRRRGDTVITPSDHSNDLTLLEVPTSCKGFITGKRGATLRQIEKEHGTLMTFCRTNEDSKHEPLAIFGTRRGRLGAQLKVMSIVEGKERGFYTSDRDSRKPIVDSLDPPTDDWGVDFMELPKEFLGFVLGAKGSTRLKLETASGCIVEYIGNWAAFGGTPKDQKRGRDYVSWLINSRSDNESWSCVDVTGRDDYDAIWVPESSVGYVTGVKANTLRKLEKSTGTFCFFEKKSGRQYEKLLIFSHIPEWRKKAIEEVRTIVIIHQRKIGRDERIIDDDDYEGEGSTKSKKKKNSRSYSNSRSRSKSIKRSKSGSRSRSKSNSRNRRSKSNSKGRRSGSKSVDRSYSRSPPSRSPSPKKTKTNLK